MRYQYARLELDRGMWHLFTDRRKKPVRRWVNREIALAELRDEGWTVTGPYPKKARERFYGYALMRAVH